MKRNGIIIFVIGVVAVCLSINYDATVPANDGDRTYNIGLLNQKSNFVLLSCFVCLVGSVLYASGILENKAETQNERLLSLIRLSKKDLIHSGIDHQEIDEIITKGNTKPTQLWEK